MKGKKPLTLAPALVLACCLVACSPMDEDKIKDSGRESMQTDMIKNMEKKAGMTDGNCRCVVDGKGMTDGMIPTSTCVWTVAA